MRFICIIIFTLAASLAIASGTKNTVPKKHAVLQADTSSKVDVRHFDANTLKNYTKDKDFRYGETTDTSWWDRTLQWIEDWILGLFNFDKLTGGSWWLTVIFIFWRIVELLLVLGGVALFIYFILQSAGVDVRNAFRRDSATIIPHSESDENINSIDFDKEIERAIGVHDYRLAVRLLYLKCLKQLSDAGRIEWKIDKTNHHYIAEIQNDSQRAEFSLLTRKFEYIWYGEFAIDAGSYNDISSAFNRFNKQAA